MIDDNRRFAMNDTAPAISPEWLNWIRDFEHFSRGMADVLTVSSEDPVELELQSLQFALYARLLTFLGTCRILGEADKLLDFRIYTRGIIECTLHLEASVADSNHLHALRDDDAASRRSRAKAYMQRRLPRLSQHDRRLLNEFVAENAGKKRLNVDNFPDTKFSALPHEFREISADSLHVTFTSLARHIEVDHEGVNRLVIDPALTADELHHTLGIMGISCITATWLLLRSCKQVDFDPKALNELKARFDQLPQR